MIGGFPSQRVSSAESIYMSWLYHLRLLLSDWIISRTIDASKLVLSPLCSAIGSAEHQSSTLLARCERNPPVISSFPSQRANNAESISMPWLYLQTNIIIVWQAHFWEQWHLLPVLAPIRFRWTSKLHISGPLWGEPTGHQWIPLTKGQHCRKHFHAMR